MKFCATSSVFEMSVVLCPNIYIRYMLNSSESLSSTIFILSLTATDNGQDLQFEVLDNFRKIPGTILYRSGNPDRLSRSDVGQLVSLGVRRVIDLRATKSKTPLHEGEMVNILNDVFESYYVMRGQGEIHYQKFDEQGQIKSVEVSISDVPRARVNVDLIKKIFSFDGLKKQLSKPLLLVFFLCRFLDKIFGSHFSLQLTIRTVSKQRGLTGYYENIIDNCGEEICSGKFALIEDVTSTILLTLKLLQTTLKQ